VSFLPPLGFTTNWGLGCNYFRSGKIDNSSVAENKEKSMGTCLVKILPTRDEYSPNSFDHHKAVDDCTDLKHLKDMLACVGDAAHLHDPACFPLDS
jgi:hypothetical protein